MDKGASLVSGTPKGGNVLGVKVESGELLEEDNGKIRHDRLALARLIVNLAQSKKEREVLCAES
jgi:hypothetical protein